VGEQLDMFGAPPPPPKPRAAKAETEDQRSARAVREELPPVCHEHGPSNVCDGCPGYGTDASGFVHRSECHGRIPLRKCRRCKRLTTPGSWNHADWYHCISCQPLGTMSDMGSARSPTAYRNAKK
jgi:hypothetical protein